MIGGLLARLLAGMASLLKRSPVPGQVRHSIPSRPPRAGTTALSDGRPSRRRPDRARQAAAQAKRERKNAKRLRDWRECWYNGCADAPYWPNGEVLHGR